MKSLFCLSGLAGVLGVASAIAYILPAGSIFRRLSEARDDAQVSSLRVDGTMSFYGETAKEVALALHQPEAPEIQTDGAIWLKVPGRCRFEARAADGAKVAAVFSNGQRRTEGPPVQAMAEASEQTALFLAIRANSSEVRSLLERHLEAFKIDIHHPWLGRLSGRVAFVLGKTDDRSPQFWVYKDTFDPARIRWMDAKQVAWDVRWLDYGSPITGDLFSRVVEVARNGETVLRFTALKADSRTRIPDKLF